MILKATGDYKQFIYKIQPSVLLRQLGEIKIEYQNQVVFQLFGSFFCI